MVLLRQAGGRTAGRADEELEGTLKELGLGGSRAPCSSVFRLCSELPRNWGLVIRKACVFRNGVGVQVTNALQAWPKRPCQG